MAGVTVVLQDIEDIEDYLGCWVDREFCGKHHVQFVHADGKNLRCPVAVALARSLYKAIDQAKAEVVARVLREHGIEEAK